MSKTPIMILQEAMVKQGYLPKYTVILTQAGTHQNIFTYRVECKGSVAEGSASNKKEAKQNAASAMLKLLEIESANPSDSKSNPILQSSKVSNTECLKSHTSTDAQDSLEKPENDCLNYVGKLQELCIQSRYPDPTYHEPIIIGPPHRTEFRIKCSVTTFEEEGSAMSKKQAKQLAAQKVYRQLVKQRQKEDSTMISEIKNVCSVLGNLQIPPSYKPVSLTEKAIQKYKHLNKKVVPRKSNGTITECHLDLKSSYYTTVKIQYIQDIKNEIPLTYNAYYGTDKTIKSIQKLFAATVEQVTMNVKENNSKIYVLRMTCDVAALTEFGVGATLMEAQFVAMKNLIETLICLMT